MARTRKQAAAPEPPIMPYIGDKVTIPRVGSVLEGEPARPQDKIVG